MIYDIAAPMRKGLNFVELGPERDRFEASFFTVPQEDAELFLIAPEELSLEVAGQYGHEYAVCLRAIERPEFSRNDRCAYFPAEIMSQTAPDSYLTSVKIQLPRPQITRSVLRAVMGKEVKESAANIQIDLPLIRNA